MIGKVNKMNEWLVNASQGQKDSLAQALQSAIPVSEVSPSTLLRDLQIVDDSGIALSCSPRGLLRIFVIENDEKFLALAQTQTSGSDLVLLEADPKGKISELGFTDESYPMFEILTELNDIGIHHVLHEVQEALDDGTLKVEEVSNSETAGKVLVSDGEGGSAWSAIDADQMTSITYADLVALRNAGSLKAGMQYRITDYVFTSNQSVASAGHVFDIIVIADSASKLNENARACLHDGDTYFANSKLEAWQLKYCLDNDRDRFAWADATNGKGVIYYMKDEWNNECFFDFKNAIRDNLYTFWSYDGSTVSDTSMNGTAHDNVIKECWDSFSHSVHGTRILSITASVTIAGHSYSNKFGINVSGSLDGNANNVVVGNDSHVTIWQRASNIEVGCSCWITISATDLKNIKIGNDCKNLVINCAESPSDENDIMQNVIIGNGVSNRTITVPDRNLSYESVYRMDGYTEYLLS